jgi:long-chain acyl-CoA synthetase
MARADRAARPVMSDRPWLAQYPRGVPQEIDTSEYPSLKDLLEKNFRKFATATAFSNRGTKLSFDEIDRMSARFAAYLRAVPGIERGDRIAVMLPNLLQSPIVIFGILRAGLVVVNVNPMYTARELEYQLKDSGARAIVVLENFIDTVEHAIAACPVERIIITSAGDQHPLPKRAVIDFVVRYIRKQVPQHRIENAVRYRDTLVSSAPPPVLDPPIAASDTAFLQYTGGTTGVAKGAVLTHGNVVSNVVQVVAWARPFFDRGRGVVVTPLPLYHVFALTVNLLGFLELGGHNVLITDPRDLKSFVNDLKRQPFAFMSGVNTLFNALLHAPGFEGLDFEAFQICLAGGMAVQRDVAERWNTVTGRPISQGYGLTEASPVVSANRLDGVPFNGSVGLPLPSTDVAILDDSGSAVADGEIGEICVKGPQVMQGYWQREEDTRAVMFPGGWLRTGDVGRMDEAGYIYIEDRIKDVIVVSGFKVYPNELEDVIMDHPGVMEAAVIGVPDSESGEKVVALVVKKDQSLSEDDLVAHCRDNLTGYKIPRAVEFVGELPKSNVGKVLRRELRQSYAKALDKA